jgi:hypothetical protein
LSSMPIRELLHNKPTTDRRIMVCTCRHFIHASVL